MRLSHAKQHLHLPTQEEAHTGSTDLNEKMHPARDAKQLILSNFINPIEKVHNFVG